MRLRRPASVAAVVLGLVAGHASALELTTPWNTTLDCGLQQCEPRAGSSELVLVGGIPLRHSVILTDAVCAVPSTGELLVYVQLQTVFTALWGLFAVGLVHLVQRWRTRPRRWNPQRTRARTRTRYNAEKDEVFLENARGEVQPVTNLERLATYTSDLDDAVMDAHLPSSSQMPMRNCHGEELRLPSDHGDDDDESVSLRHCSFVEGLSAVTTVKFGNSFGTALAAFPTVLQLCVGVWLRSRPGGACPHTPRIAGWFGYVGIQSTVPAQVAATIIAFYPSRFLAPVIAIVALAVQCVWNGSLLLTLGAMAGPELPSTVTAATGCMSIQKLFKVAQGRVVTALLIELFTIAATVMFAMHIRPRKRDVDARMPISRIGLTVLAVILVALQSTRAPILTAAYPAQSSLKDALSCAVETRGLDRAYAFGRFISLL